MFLRRRNAIGKLFIVAYCLTFLFIYFRQGATQPLQPPNRPPNPTLSQLEVEEPEVEYVLSLKVIKGNLLTLHAVNASLKSVIQQIGAKLKIEVVIHLKDEETITLDFEELDIIKAIDELSKFANFIYYKDAKTGKVKKIIVTPKSQK